MTQTTPPPQDSAGLQVQKAVSVVLRWASRSGVRTELYGHERATLSLTDLWLLEAIVSDGPIRASELAAWQGVDKSTVTPQLRRIEQRGLIARHPDPRDNRAALLTVTAAGRRFHRKVVGTGERVFEDLLAHWSDQDRRAFGALLTRFATELVDRPPRA